MNKQQLAAKIWESANQMRSKIEANEYKDYDHKWGRSQFYRIPEPENIFEKYFGRADGHDGQLDQIAEGKRTFDL